MLPAPVIDPEVATPVLTVSVDPLAIESCLVTLRILPVLRVSDAPNGPLESIASPPAAVRLRVPAVQLNSDGLPLVSSELAVIVPPVKLAVEPLSKMRSVPEL